MIDINKGSRILVVAAHPDDEVLGCGGSISKWVGMGAETHALILAEGLTSRTTNAKKLPASEYEKLRKDAIRCADIIGYSSVSFESFPDNRMDSVDLLDVIHTVSDHVTHLNPDIIMTHHGGDLNIDHRVTFRAVITACRPLADGIGSGVSTIISFETPSSTEWSFPYHANIFSPNIFVDIADFVETKISAVNCYESEVREAPHPRSPESLRAIAARWGSVIERPYAEAFELIRTVLI